MRENLFYATGKDSEKALLLFSLRSTVFQVLQSEDQAETKAKSVNHRDCLSMTRCLFGCTSQ